MLQARRIGRCAPPKSFPARWPVESYQIGEVRLNSSREIAPGAVISSARAEAERRISLSNRWNLRCFVFRNDGSWELFRSVQNQTKDQTVTMLLSGVLEGKVWAGGCK